MQVVQVSDVADPRLDDFRGLTDADARPDRRGIVIAEGANVVARLARSRCRVRAVIGVAPRIAELDVLPGLRDVVGYVVDKSMLSEVVGFRVTRGVLAAADRPAPMSVAAALRGARRVVVLESLNDFENLGALFRNAAAFGVHAVLLDQQCADPLYRRSVRVSMGHVCNVAFAVLPGPLPAVVPTLRRHRFTILALSPSGEVDLRSLSEPAKWAVMLGAEGPGLTEAAMAHADLRVRITMADGVDSLNVATAAAVAFAHLGG